MPRELTEEPLDPEQPQKRLRGSPQCREFRGGTLYCPHVGMLASICTCHDTRMAVLRQSQCEHECEDDAKRMRLSLNSVMAISALRLVGLQDVLQLMVLVIGESVSRILVSRSQHGAITHYECIRKGCSISQLEESRRK